jgi:hypothetical protein
LSSLFKSGVAKALALVGIAVDGVPDDATSDVPEEQLQAQLLVEQHHAAQREEALRLVRVKLGVARRQLAAVEGYKSHFINPELLHLLTQCNGAYMHHVAELQKLHSRMGALSKYFGHVGSDDIRLPQFASLPKDTAASKFTLKWMRMMSNSAERLERDPDASISLKP